MSLRSVVLGLSVWPLRGFVIRLKTHGRRGCFKESILARCCRIGISHSKALLTFKSKALGLVVASEDNTVLSRAAGLYSRKCWSTNDVPSGGSGKASPSAEQLQDASVRCGHNSLWCASSAAKSISLVQAYDTAVATGEFFSRSFFRRR